MMQLQVVTVLGVGGQSCSGMARDTWASVSAPLVADIVALVLLSTSCSRSGRGFMAPSGFPLMCFILQTVRA